MSDREGIQKIIPEMRAFVPNPFHHHRAGNGLPHLEPRDLTDKRLYPLLVSRFVWLAMFCITEFISKSPADSLSISCHEIIMGKETVHVNTMPKN
jgi:hypothetical protein